MAKRGYWHGHFLLAELGEDVFIDATAYFRRPHLVSIGSHVAIDFGVYVTTALEVGDYCHIAPYVTIIGGPQGLLRLGHFCTIAAGSRVICGSDSHLGLGLVGPTIPPGYEDELKIEPVIFENFASVGTNVVIMPGVRLAEGSVVGACSLVTKSTEPWTIYYGAPAKPQKRRPSHVMKQYAKELGCEDI